MTCLEAQSVIMAYIDGKLSKEQKIQFLKHVATCSNCKEELNIYYTMIVGMRQLDENQPLSKDFSLELDNRIRSELKNDRKKRSFFKSSMCLIVISIIGFLIVLYTNFLSILHDQEQENLKLAQGETYFSDYFDEYLFRGDDSAPSIHVKVEEREVPSDFYSKIRDYHLLQ